MCSIFTISYIKLKKQEIKWKQGHIIVNIDENISIEKENKRQNKYPLSKWKMSPNISSNKNIL